MAMRPPDVTEQTLVALNRITATREVILKTRNEENDISAGSEEVHFTPFLGDLLPKWLAGT